MKKGLRNLGSTRPPYNLCSGCNVPLEKSKSTRRVHVLLLLMGSGARKSTTVR